MSYALVVEGKLTAKDAAVIDTAFYFNLANSATLRRLRASEKNYG